MVNKARAIAMTTAAALGIGLGSYGVAAATTGPDPDPAADTQETDGIDHQFDGEEVGENGNGIPDPDEASEAD